MKFPYNPEQLPREMKRHYISMSEAEEKIILDQLGHKKLEDLYSHLPDDIRFKTRPDIGPELSYSDLANHLKTLSLKNSPKISFIGDGLSDFKVPESTPFVCSLRNLTTAYTPYQPERCQGTLQSLWAYSCSISMLTGFEAVNASLYERATCLYEAIQTSLRLYDKRTVALVAQNIYPGDLEVLYTHAQETVTKIIEIPIDSQTGRLSILELKKLLQTYQGQVASVSFPQVNNLGLLEDVHTLTDTCKEHDVASIAIIDPMLLATGGLCAPSEFGSSKEGVTMIVGEGQHIGLGPNFGGPGLGVFGIRYNQKDKNAIRSTAGRYVGKGQDKNGKEALALVLSTREQHIRREKATSNICSNQSFVATIAGAALLWRGEKGMQEAVEKSKNNAFKLAQKLTSIPNVKLAYPEEAFFNQFTLELPCDTKDILKAGEKAGLFLGIDVSKRLKRNGHFLLVSCFDKHTDEQIESYGRFFAEYFKATPNNKTSTLPSIAPHLLRQNQVGLPQFSHDHIKEFYQKLNDLNVSPDDNIYPLGSCTMKYNPYINDWAASLPGFTDLHPEAPSEHAQGSLQILFEIQEMFKAITGLQGVTTEPLAGAQGELVGLKLFQAYHRDRGEGEQRDILLIPRSAHGTNPATATMAGIETITTPGKKKGIITVEADEHGLIDMQKFEELIKEYNTRIIGVMVTNPNTSGLFETSFKKMADLVHSVGGLVYMDGANMNAIAGHVNLGAMGVDAVHNNLHKTWSIPHGGGGPGDAIVAVSNLLIDYLPGHQIIKQNGQYKAVRSAKCIGRFHRHWGNFAHKVRCYTYLKALGSDGVYRMSAVAVLSANYLYHKLKSHFSILPENTENVRRMHEFILTLDKDTFDRIAKAGTPKATTMAKIGKLFLDFGLHAPTVAFPEVYGLMIEPTETYSLKELDEFISVVKTIHGLLKENPEVLTTAPHFTPVGKIDEVEANKNLCLFEPLHKLPKLYENVFPPRELGQTDPKKISEKILTAHRRAVENV